VSPTFHEEVFQMSLEGDHRKAYILGQIETEGHVKTDALVKRFSVSSETIRRYLEELENEKKLLRVYGGAKKLRIASEESSHLIREVLHAKEKRVIGKAAAGLVEDGEAIFIDEGTTSLQMVEHLVGKKDLTVITTSIPVLSRLILLDQKDLLHCTTIIIGGTVNPKHLRVTGSIAERMADGIHADRSFITVDGVSLGKGYSANSIEKACLSKRLIDNSRQGIALVDDSKIGVDCFYAPRGMAAAAQARQDPLDHGGQGIGAAPRRLREELQASRSREVDRLPLPSPRDRRGMPRRSRQFT
jgi:DeoR family fructose operon transcriptional repressor